MPRQRRSEPTRRLNLELTDPVRIRLEEMRDELGAESLAEVVRKSLSLLDYVWSRKKSGYSLLLRDDETKTEQLIEFL
jgi:hypothetical protein